MSASTPLLSDESSPTTPNFPPSHEHEPARPPAPSRRSYSLSDSPEPSHAKWAREKGPAEQAKGRRVVGLQLIVGMLVFVLVLGVFGGFHLGGKLAGEGEEAAATAAAARVEAVEVKASVVTETATRTVTSTKTQFATATTTATVRVEVAAPSALALDPSKLAVMIEPRHQPILVPILLDFIHKVPAEYAHQLWTSQATVDSVSATPSMQEHIASGKFSMRVIPDKWDVHDGKTLSAFMVSPEFWAELAPAEYILTYQTDSILCGNSDFTVNDFLGIDVPGKLPGGYAYVGAVWAKHGYPAPPNGGNGGLSLRRRSIMLDVTQKETGWTRWNEDMWLVQGVKKHYDSDEAFPDQDVAMRFSFEAAPKGTEEWDWVARPLGIHSGSSCRKRNHKYPNLIRKLVDYCPEARMILPADCLPPDVKKHW